MLNKVENIGAKGEIAHHEQFHLWPQFFNYRLLLLRQNTSAGEKWLTKGLILQTVYVGVNNQNELKGCHNFLFPGYMKTVQK